MCAVVFEIEVETKAYHDWATLGKLIQDVFPTLSPDIRELLISGVCGRCFDKMFPADEVESDPRP